MEAYKGTSAYDVVRLVRAVLHHKEGSKTGEYSEEGLYLNHWANHGEIGFGQAPGDEDDFEYYCHMTRHDGKWRFDVHSDAEECAGKLREVLASIKQKISN